MTKLKYLLLSLFLIGVQNNLLSQWYTNLIDDSGVKCFYKANNYFYVLTNRGINFSTDGGNFWSQMGIDTLYSNIFSTLIYHGNKLYVGSSSTFGILATSDDGITWEQLNNGLEKQSIKTLISAGQDIYAGTREGVFVSSTQGQSWTQVNSGLTNLIINTFAVNGSNIFCGTNDGVFLSTNNGINWTPRNSGLASSSQIYSLYFKDGNLFAGTDENGVFLSTNNGLNWIEKNSGLNTVESIYCFTSLGNDYYAGTIGRGVFRSTNLGDNWTQINSGLGLSSLYIGALIEFNERVYCGLTNIDGRVFWITNSATTWNELTSGLTYHELNPIIVYENDIITGGTLNLKFYKSTNNGSSWTEISSIPGFGGNSFIYAKDKKLFTCMWSLGIYSSTNGGYNWSSINSGLSSTYASTITSKDNSLYAGFSDSGIFKSTNDGTSWAACNTGLGNKDVRCFMVKDNSIFAGTLNGIYVSTNDGGDWAQINLGVPNLVVSSIISNGSFLYVATRNAGIFVSSNNGADWDRRNSGIPNLVVSSLCYTKNILFANAWFDGIFYSTNNGLTWIDYYSGFSKGYYPMYGRQFAYNDNYLFSTSLNGVYRSDISNIISINNLTTEIPDKYFLYQNYPNPFNPSTKIKFEIPEKTFTEITVYNLLGKKIKSLVSEILNNGTYSVDFSAENIPSGIYFYKLETEKINITKKMLFLK